MKSLLNFILNYHYFLLFILVEFFALLLLFQNNDYQHATFLNSSSQLSGAIYEKFNSVAQYTSLKKTNIELNESLALYRNAEYKTFNPPTENQKNLVDSGYKPQYEFIPAQVINNSINKQNNFITLNVGSNQGVSKNMAVVSALGTVGIVKDVSANYTSVISILNQNFKLSAMLKHSGHFGTLFWDGSDYQHVKLIDLPNHIKVQPGDTVLTSGYSSIFPRGETIGFVSEVYNTEGSFFLEVKVKLAVDFKSVSHVMVIRNHMRTEQLTLETYAEHDK